MLSESSFRIVSKLPVFVEVDNESDREESGRALTDSTLVDWSGET